MKDHSTHFGVRMVPPQKCWFTPYRLICREAIHGQAPSFASSPFTTRLCETVEIPHFEFWRSQSSQVFIQSLAFSAFSQYLLKVLPNQHLIPLLLSWHSDTDKKSWKTVIILYIKFSRGPEITFRSFERKCYNQLKSVFRLRKFWHDFWRLAWQSGIYHFVGNSILFL